MTQENVKKVMNRLSTDVNFRKNFYNNPQLTIKQFSYNISEQEIKALLKINVKDVNIYKKNKMLSNVSDLETFSSIMAA